MRNIKSIALILVFALTFLGCGGGSNSGSDSASEVTPTTRILNVGDSDILNKGDKIVTLTDDTKLNIVTDAETLESNVTVLTGSAEVTKYN